MDIAAAVREMRQQKGISQYELATLCGMQHGQISRLESGKHVPTTGTVLKVASALDVKVSDIYALAERHADTEAA